MLREKALLKKTKKILSVKIETGAIGFVHCQFIKLVQARMICKQMICVIFLVKPNGFTSNDDEISLVVSPGLKQLAASVRPEGIQRMGGAPSIHKILRNLKFLFYPPSLKCPLTQREAATFAGFLGRVETFEIISTRRRHKRGRAD